MIKTKKAQIRKAYALYKKGWYDGISLSDVYSRYSDRKEYAYRDCVRFMLKHNGTGGVILTHNCDVFTFAFIGIDPETGEIAFYYITPAYNYYCPLSDLENVQG